MMVSARSRFTPQDPTPASARRAAPSAQERTRSDGPEESPRTRPSPPEVRLPLLAPATVRGQDVQSDLPGTTASTPRTTPRFEGAGWALESVPMPDDRRLATDLSSLFPTGYSVRGADPGSRAELGLRYLLYRVSPSLSPLTIHNVLVPDLDFEGHVGRVRLEVDAQGAPIAELIGFGDPEVSVSFASREEASERIARDFQLGGVTDDGVAAWGRRELQKVYAAFDCMPPREREALRGVELHRARSNATREAPLRIGFFEWTSGITNGRADETTKLSLDDRVFASDASSFSGDAWPASFLSILHEAGHAVESKEVRQTLFAVNDAVARYNDKVNVFNATPADQQGRLRPELDAIGREVEETRAALARAQRPDGRSALLVDFLDYTSANGVEPPTDYAATGAADFFAESYTLFRTERDVLARANPGLAAYFETRGFSS